MLAGMQRWTGCAALGAVLADREKTRAREAYAGQLLWHIGAMLYGRAGGGDWPMPDYFAVFPPRKGPGEGSGAGVVRHVLRRLEGREMNGGCV